MRGWAKTGVARRLARTNEKIAVRFMKYSPEIKIEERILAFSSEGFEF
jgi:hypothetical protein